MTYVLLLFAALVLLLLAGVLPVRDGDPAIVFRSPVFLAILWAMAVSLLWCACRRMTLRHAGFLLAHVGIVLILAGAFVAHRFGIRTDVAVPVTAEHLVSEVPLRGATTEGQEQARVALDFGFAVTNFAVEFHDPHYNLFRPAPGTNGARSFAFVRKAAVPHEGRMDLGKGGQLDVRLLRDPVTGEWVEQLPVENGWVLERVRTASRYAAALRFVGPSGELVEREIVMNRPARFHGWRFYLMDYDHEFGRYVVLTVRRDPGRPLVMIGIWAVIAGVAALCFRGARPSSPASGEGVAP